jgi:desulfoferrodoxin (superoxide reductase-like protein)
MWDNIFNVMSWIILYCKIDTILINRNEVENEMKNQVVLSTKPKAEVPDTNWGLDNCSYHAKTGFKNSFIFI